MHSDCCLTCWHNRGAPVGAGAPAAESSEDHHCLLRDFRVEEPAITHCANHPRRFPRRLPLPVGPVYRTDGFGQRVVWRLSPDSGTIRRLLLALLEEMPETPRSEYPFGIPFDETLIWQLGEFRDSRAAPGLRRVARFDPNQSDPVFGLNRYLVVRRAGEALAKIERTEQPLDSGSGSGPAQS